MSQGVREKSHTQKCDSLNDLTSRYNFYIYISTKHDFSAHYKLHVFMILFMFLSSEERRLVSVRGARGCPV